MPKELLMMSMEFLLRAVIIVIGYYVVNFIKKRNLEKWVEFCVRAAEQLAIAGIIDFEERKEYVKQRVLEKFSLTEEELDVLIEAAVEELNRLQKSITTSLIRESNVSNIGGKTPLF